MEGMKEMMKDMDDMMKICESMKKKMASMMENHKGEGMGMEEKAKKRFSGTYKGEKHG